MSALGKEGEKEDTHICVIPSLRGSYLEKQVEQTPTVLEVKKNWASFILTAYY